jgi:hypothetical protein
VKVVQREERVRLEKRENEGDRKRKREKIE